jgi:DNA-binding transcriptional ArsR family regulator
MLKRVCMVVFLLLLPLVVAQEDSNLVISFVDVISKEIISDAFVKVEVDGKISDYYLGKEETLRLKLKDGDYHLRFFVNNPLTKGYDYYGVKDISLIDSQVQIIYLYPGGSLSGSVKDKVGTAISEADLKFDCNTAVNVDYPEKTDKFGSFSLNYVPIGVCKVYGSFEDDLGIKEIEIKPGVKNFVEINLDQTVATPSKNNYLFFIFIFAILIIFILLFSFRKKIKKLTKKEKQEEKEVKILKNEIKEIKSLEDLGQRGKDIFRTLRKNEKAIIEFLVEEKEPVYFSKIHYKTGLSKGSLSRNIKSLEDKNIIKTFKEGKIRKIKLSEWFLEK